jgi:tetratricopeptide (TPR) repeat protein
MTAAELHYRAFISYSHRDERWAAWLHKSLERYRVPRRLVGRTTPMGIVPARVAPVFRDREELATATDLGRVVNAALAQSAALIVICSPASARSRWVNEEIRAFQRLGRPERIFCLIVDGEPNAGDARECFPEGLRSPLEREGAERGKPAEPIGADVRPGKDRRQVALLKVLAGLLGVGLDELARRELQRRNRRLAVISAASVAGMAGASVLAAVAVLARNEAEEQRARAEVEAATAQQTSEFLVGLFEVVDPSEARGNTITAREILDRGAARIDRELASQPAVRATLMQTMGRVYTGLGLYADATDLLERALAVRRELAQAATAETISVANALGAALYLKGEYDAAGAVYTEALDGARRLFPDGDPRLTEAMTGRADVLSQNGDLAAAEAEYTAALAIDRRLHGDVHPDVARSLAGLASALLYQERFEASEAAWREALAIRRQTLGEDHPLVGETLNNLASSLYFAGRVDAAELVLRDAAAHHRRVFGEEHPEVSNTLNNLGRVLLERGEIVEAERLLAEALSIDRKLKDPGHDDLIFTLNNLGLARLGLGQVAAAIDLLDEARMIAEAHQHRMLGQVLANLADAYSRDGQPAEALSAVAAARPLLAADQPDERWHEANLEGIEVMSGGGPLDDAEARLLASYSTIAERWGPDSVFTALAGDRLARAYEASGAPERAREYRRLGSATR